MKSPLNPIESPSNHHSTSLFFIPLKHMTPLWRLHQRDGFERRSTGGRSLRHQKNIVMSAIDT
jgi:hypothetical protein